ncbi:MAG: hypothetical protein RLZZ65_945 [Bacteroidota bacterium]|jgi:hypothetical protein
MKIINRGFIQVKPKQSFIDWALKIEPELLIDTDSEGTLYLVEEDFWDDEQIIQKYAQKIWKQECSSICEETELWPELKERLEIEKYFVFELGCTVIDLLKETIESEKI